MRLRARRTFATFRSSIRLVGTFSFLERYLPSERGMREGIFQCATYPIMECEINVQCRILTQRDNPAQFGRFNNRHELSYVDGAVRFSIRIEALEPERSPIIYLHRCKN